MQLAAQFDLFDYLRARQESVNAELARSVAAAYPERLYDAMRYSLMSGGKRLRPVLCIAACEATAGAAPTALPTACALEMLHTATLIHDDIAGGVLLGIAVTVALGATLPRVIRPRQRDTH